MTGIQKTRKTLALAMATTFAAMGFASAVQAQEQRTIPRGWFKACSKQGDRDICNTQNVILAGNGQLITAVNFIDIKGAQNQKVLQVTVPIGRLIAPGVGMSIDGGQTNKVDYSICFADRCIAEAPLTDALITAFKKGGNVTMTSINFQRQRNPVEISLSGFTAAFDGDPIDQTTVEDRQKELAEQIKKRKDDFAKRLKEEQEKAKAAN